MTELIWILVAIDVLVIGFFVVLCVRAALADLKHRGEDPVDEHAEEAMAVLDAQVPQGTGEALAREIQDYFKEIQR